MDLSIRAARLGDVPELTQLLNEIIAVGGTTAHEDPMSETYFRAHYLDDPELVSFLVAEGDEGVLYGFQVLARMKELPSDWADIGSFARASGVRGVGRALFAETCRVARAAGVRTINAQIRADNVPGLGYYGAMGFLDYDRLVGMPLKDGTLVDRILKRYDL
ncbi:MAG: GNAT family N-acetyltransferase [Pseudomonadota bacterium]